MKFSYIIWVLYLLVFPIYFFDEGNPQLAEGFGVLLILLNLRDIILNLFNSTYTKFLVYFLVLTIIVNSIWMVILGDIITLLHSVYYIYAFLLFMFVYIHLKDEKFIKITIKTILVIMVFLIVIMPFIPYQGYRTQLFFNNPNQLALWALCILIIINSLSLIYKLNRSLVHFITVLSTFFILLSASRSATVAVVLFWMFFFIRSRKNFIIMSILFTIFLIVATLSNFIQLENLSMINYIIDRLTGEAQPNDKGLAGRGYDRMIDFPEYLLFGAGEGVFDRFNTNMELHSTFFNVWFSYGFLGLLLFGRALLLIVIKSYREIIVLFLVLGIFGNVHMTLRIPIYWMALGVLFYVKHQRRQMEVA